ncbi:MAG: SlyX family protein [Mariprofundales bacterium]
MESRLESMECKLAFVEELVEQLNGVVSSQQRQIDRQQQQLDGLRHQMKSGGSQLARPEDEAPPPHY